jgi:transposase-like protein
LIKALRAWFGKKLVHQRCAIHKSRNLQRHLAKPYRPEAHRRLMTALEQTNYADARRMLRELEAWLRTKNESAAESLVEAFEELLALHQGQVPPLLRKTLLSTNPIESMFSLVRHSERNIKRTRGAACFSDGSARYCSRVRAVQKSEGLCRDCTGHGKD